MTALARDLGGEAHGSVRFRVVGGAAAVGRDLCVVELGEVLAEIRVGGQAVVAAVDLGDGERDALVRRGWQRALAQRADRPR